jgi:hypothetical protein
MVRRVTTPRTTTRRVATRRWQPQELGIDVKGPRSAFTDVSMAALMYGAVLLMQSCTHKSSRKRAAHLSGPSASDTMLSSPFSLLATSSFLQSLPELVGNINSGLGERMKRTVYAGLSSSMLGSIDIYAAVSKLGVTQVHYCTRRPHVRTLEHSQLRGK